PRPTSSAASHTAPAITHRCNRWFWQSGRGVAHVTALLGEEVGRRRGMIRREPVGLGQRNVLLVGSPAGRSSAGSLLLVLQQQLPAVPRRGRHAALSRPEKRSATGTAPARSDLLTSAPTHSDSGSPHLTRTPEPATISPMTGCPGNSPTTSRPPEV